MIGNYLRLLPEELERLLANPDNVSEVIYPDGGSGDHPANRHLDIDKAWHAIQFLLTGDAWDGEPPLQNAVMGGTEIGEEDIGYGPARSLTPAQVKAVASALASISGEQLWSRFDERAFAEAEIYPQGLTEEDKDYIVGNYETLQKFFADAAAANDAMLLYLN